jgi:FkbM family methyltransferase
VQAIHVVCSERLPLPQSMVPLEVRFGQTDAMTVVWRRLKLMVAAALSMTIRSLSPTGSVGTLVEAPTGRFLVPVGDVFVARRIGQHTGHDAAVLRTAMAATEPGSEVLVVGAHVGVHAIPLARAGRRVAVVEANPATFELLMANARLNDVEFVGAVQAAAHRSPGVVRFLASASNTGGSKVRPRRSRFEYVYDRPAEIEVPRIRIDEWEPAQSMTTPFLVMDIEGSEADALAGMPTFLAACAGAVVEIHPAAAADAAGVAALETVLAEHFVAARDVESPGDRYEPGSCVVDVERRHGPMASVDLEFSKQSFA